MLFQNIICNITFYAALNFNIQFALLLSTGRNQTYNCATRNAKWHRIDHQSSPSFNVDKLMNPGLGGKAQAAIFAPFNNTRSFQTDILQRMAEGSPASITYCHLSFNLNNRNFLEKLKCVGTVLPKFEFGFMVCASVHPHFLICFICSFRINIIRCLGRN